MNNSTAENFWGGVVHTYTRQDAIDDGCLIDTTHLARDVGIVFSTALTRAVWDLYVEVPEGVTCQDETGRLWDILWMFRCEFLRLKRSGKLKEIFCFKMSVRNDESDPKLIELKAMIHPGDNGEGVITIMMPHED